MSSSYLNAIHFNLIKHDCLTGPNARAQIDHETVHALRNRSDRTSVAAFLVYVGILPIEGGVTSGRLEFTFQYANATAIWFGVCTLLCLLGTDDRMRAFAALPVAAMLLTQSGGAVLSFLVVAGATGIWLHKSGEQELLLDALVQGVLGIAFFAVMVTLASPASLLALVLTVAASLAPSRGPAPRAR